MSAGYKSFAGVFMPLAEYPPRYLERTPPPLAVELDAGFGLGFGGVGPEAEVHRRRAVGDSAGDVVGALGDIRMLECGDGDKFPLARALRFIDITISRERII